MPRPVLGQDVLYNTGNSSFWHPAKITMIGDDACELVVTQVHGREQGDWGGTNATLDVKPVCWHEDDPRIAMRTELWQTIIEGQVGGKWKFDDKLAGHIEDVAYLQRAVAFLEKRLAKVDRFLLELGHADTQGNQPGPEPKPAKAKSTKTPLADSDNAEE